MSKFKDAFLWREADRIEAQKKLFAFLAEWSDNHGWDAEAEGKNSRWVARPQGDGSVLIDGPGVALLNAAAAIYGAMLNIEGYDIPWHALSPQAKAHVRADLRALAALEGEACELAFSGASDRNQRLLIE